MLDFLLISSIPLQLHTFFQEWQYMVHGLSFLRGLLSNILCEDLRWIHPNSIF